jgi:hypothetical protein
MLSTTPRAPLSEHGDDEHEVPEPVGDAYSVVSTAA